MTTIKELIDLLTQAGDKLGYDMPVIMEPSVDCADVDYGVFPAYEVIDDDEIQPLFLETKQVQMSVPDENGHYSFGYNEFKKEFVAAKRDVLVITSPAYKYGGEKNNF